MPRRWGCAEDLIRFGPTCAGQTPLTSATRRTSGRSRSRLAGSRARCPECPRAARSRPVRRPRGLRVRRPGRPGSHRPPRRGFRTARG